MKEPMTTNMTTINEIRSSALRLFGHWEDRVGKPVPSDKGVLIDGWFRLQVREELAKRRKKRGWQGR
jgi:hypothetical protein